MLPKKDGNAKEAAFRRVESHSIMVFQKMLQNRSFWYWWLAFFLRLAKSSLYDGCPPTIVSLYWYSFFGNVRCGEGKGNQTKTAAKFQGGFHVVPMLLAVWLLLGVWRHPRDFEYGSGWRRITMAAVVAASLWLFRWEGSR